MQRRSGAELARRRAAIVAAVRAVAPLEFVNGGGTGSVEKTAAEAAVTEIGAGSGLYQPRLFDSYRGFRGQPAALFALPVVRRPGRGVVTALGGGYLASGAANKARLPRPLPAGRAPAGPAGGRGRGADAAARRRGGPAADRGPGLVPARQGGRAVRAVQRAAPDRGQRGDQRPSRPTGAKARPSPETRRPGPAPAAGPAGTRSRAPGRGSSMPRTRCRQRSPGPRSSRARGRR